MNFSLCFILCGLHNTIPTKEAAYHQNAIITQSFWTAQKYRVCFYAAVHFQTSIYSTDIQDSEIIVELKRSGRMHGLKSLLGKSA